MSMINTLKNRAFENQLAMPGQQPMPQQPMPQQAPMSPQTMPNNYPQMQAIEGMQKRKAELEKQYSNMNPNKSMLGGAAQAVMNTPAGESLMAVLARGLMGANQGLKAHGMEQNENLRQQAEIDQTISNTYQFIKDYDYNRAIKREEMGMKHRELELKEMDILGKQAKYAHEGAKMGLEQQKFAHEQSKDTQEDYEYRKRMTDKMLEIREYSRKMKPWDAFSANTLKGDAFKMGMMGQNSVEDMQHINKLTKELILLISEQGKGRGSDLLRKYTQESKVGLDLGKKAFDSILDANIQSNRKILARDDYALDKVKKGVPIDVGLRTYDKFTENPRVFKTPDRVLNFYQQYGKLPTYAEMLELNDAEKAKTQTQDQSGNEKQQASQQKQMVNTGSYEENEGSVYKDADAMAKEIIGMGK